MFRFLMICALLGLALVWVDAQWEADKRALTLRMRSGSEIRALALERARRLGSEWVQSWTTGDPDPSAVSGVASAPPQPAAR